MTEKQIARLWFLLKQDIAMHSSINSFGEEEKNIYKQVLIKMSELECKEVLKDEQNPGTL